jgi:glycine/D-amino acid oxidase-like deaminating enzyme
VTVGHALWPDLLLDSERAALAPGWSDSINRQPDVLVVGGGMLGMATATACVRANLGSVVLLERDRLGAGPSGGATGLLQPEAHVGTDPPFFVDLMRQSLVGWRELEASTPGGVGLSDLDYRGQPQARVNPLRALARLAANLPAVATGVDVTGVRIGSARVQSVVTSRGEFTPGVVVFATGNPPRVQGLDLALPWGEVKGHMLATEPTAVQLSEAVKQLATSIDQGRLIMGGTLDVGDDERVVRPDVIARMWSELETASPELHGVRISHQWACFRPAHPDHIPVVDRIPGLTNAWLTSGHYKTGVLMAPLTGSLLAQWIITTRQPPDSRPFAVSRFKDAKL